MAPVLKHTLAELVESGRDDRTVMLEEVNLELEKLSAQERMAWAFEHLPGTFAVTSSFGIQSAVMLHLATQVRGDVPIILTDTGYLFPETYRFIDELTRRLKLNLKVFSARESPAWQEARYGKLWEQGLSGIEEYNRINKVEPMLRALRELEVGSWFAGLRRGQSSSRAALPILGVQNGVFKMLPIADWTDDDVHAYLQKHKLPYHPLKAEGYVSVGDVHTTQKLKPGMKAEQTRFFGLKRECGLHEDAGDSAKIGSCRVPQEFLPFRVKWATGGKTAQVR